MTLDRATELLARPGALRWALFLVGSLYLGLWLFGFDNVADRLGFPRHECPVEALRMGE
jgi:hypothetical protein